MTYFLPAGSHTDGDAECAVPAPEAGAPADVADLKIFWGPEICRLEYLIHLLETGRVKDEYWPRSA